MPEVEALTYTVLTTTPNAALQPLHDRMPVILPPDAYTVWLDPALRDVESVQTLLTPYTAEEMLACPVRTLVTGPARHTAACATPIG